MDELDLMDPMLVSERNRMNALSGWDKETNRAGRTARARATKAEKRLAQLKQEIDPQGVLPPEELAARIRTRQKLRKARRRYEQALDERKQQVTGPSVAADSPAGETAITQSARTGQEPR